jgi:hypothetical protein
MSSPVPYKDLFILLIIYHNYHRHRIIIYITVTYLVNIWRDLLRLKRKSLSFPNVLILSRF